MPGVEVLIDDPKNILEDFQIYCVAEELVANCADKKNPRSSKKVQVKLTASRSEEGIQVRVEDNFIYPAKIAAEIVDELNNKEQPEREKVRPGGLGVFLSKKIAAGTKGKLRYSLEENRIVATFTCEVPTSGVG